MRQREERKDFKKVIVKIHAVMIIMPSETDVAPKAIHRYSSLVGGPSGLHMSFAPFGRSGCEKHTHN